MSFFSRRRRPAPEQPDGSPTAPAPALPLITPGGIDLLSRALELANDDWTEQEAALELARLAAFDREILLRVYERLVAELVGSPGLDTRRIRATRVVSRATRLSAASAFDGQELRQRRW